MTLDSEDNLRRLQQCEGHRFGHYDGISVPMTCERCGGRMTPRDIQLYCQGYAAAGGNPNEVMVQDDGGES